MIPDIYNNTSRCSSQFFLGSNSSLNPIAVGFVLAVGMCGRYREKKKERRYTLDEIPKLTDVTALRAIHGLYGRGWAHVVV
jgi:hypothetical protein